ncbi:MAG: amidohydrolase family protein [Candidatus Marinimicrobia bacterium]|nr:amidohydrolase family protein [Candidatus Neomarinimicrobiota bacterium]
MANTEKYDLLIKNGTVIDGTGAPGFKADVLVKGESIFLISNTHTASISAQRTIDATGRVVTPGFIDNHAHGNPLVTPEFKNFSAMGVTTIFLGQDGDSPENISEWMNQVEAKNTTINIGTYVGHGAVRNQAGVKLDPKPSYWDRRKMAAQVQMAMEAGCFGLSTGLEYQPGSFSKLNELIAIAKPVGKRGGLVSSHTRNEDDEAVQNSIAELINQGRDSGCAVNISHLKVVYGQGANRAEAILNQMEEARKQGIAITADMYPYLASYTGIGIVFPDWAKPPNNYTEIVASRRDELADYLRNRIQRRNGPEATLFGTAPWAGKTLAQVAIELNKPFEDVLIDDVGPRGASGAYFVMNQELQDRLFLDPNIMAGSDGSPTMRHPRGYGSFAKVIRYYVNEKNLLTLEEAVYKMSGLPAKTVGLIEQKRGLLKAGYAADILVFDPHSILDVATFENPHELAEGFEWVIVNGDIIRTEGEFTGKHPGKMLRKH